MDPVHINRRHKFRIFYRIDDAESYRSFLAVATEFKSRNFENDLSRVGRSVRTLFLLAAVQADGQGAGQCQ